MRSKDYRDSYWCFYGDSYDSVNFIAQRTVEIHGFLFNVEKNKKFFGLKYKYRINEGEFTEEFKTEKRTEDEYITMPNVDEKWKFIEFKFKDTGCPSVVVEEGQKFCICAMAVDREDYQLEYVERSSEETADPQDQEKDFKMEQSNSDSNGTSDYRGMFPGIIYITK